LQGSSYSHDDHVPLIRNTFHRASKRDGDALKRDVKPIYNAVNVTAAGAALDELAGSGASATAPSSASGRTPRTSSSRSWTTTSTGPQGRLLDKCHRFAECPLPEAVKTRGHFPKQAAMKCRL
jgi:transposase-like protein